MKGDSDVARVDRNKKKEVLETLKENDKKTNIRLMIFVLAIIFVLIFLFNLLRPMLSASVKDGEVSDNIKTVEAIQTAEVKSVETAVKQMEASYEHDSSSGIRVKYRRKFADSIILGDSLTEGLVVYGWLPESVVYADIGGSISQGEAKFKKAAKTLPEHAFFAYGMNDMGNYAGDETAFVKQYSKLLKQFGKISPDTEINVCSITAPTAAAQKGNKSIRAYKRFNKAIKKMCKDEGYNFINVTDILETHKNLYEGDGIHAKPEYYPYWMKRVVSESGL